LLPDHAPAAEHCVALLLDHVSVEAPPGAMLLGLADNVTNGGSADTFTIADCVAKPPGPLQVSSYSVVLESAPVDQVPFAATAPLQPPLAVHPVACSEVQCRVEPVPLATVEGMDSSTTTGISAVTTISADCEADPPGPVQVSVKRVFAPIGPVAALPMVGREPDQPPEAVQDCASVVFHCSVVSPPAGTLLSAAFNVTDGLAKVAALCSVIMVSLEAD